MDTRFLESFVLVVEHGSIAEAARRLNLTPAAVTQRLRALEREIGATLVLRSGQRVKPTDMGAAILQQAHGVIRAVRDLSSLAQGNSLAGELRLGAVSSALTGLLPSTFAAVIEKHPDIRLFVSPGSSNELYGKVIDGSLDGAVVVEPQFALPKTCGWLLWRTEPLVVLVHRSIKETDPHVILRTQPFIRYDRKQWGGRLADNYLQQARIQPMDRFELDSLDAIALLVNRGLGVSLVPDWSPPWPEGLSLQKLSLPNATQERKIGIVWDRASARLRLIQALLDEVRLQKPI